MSPRGASGATLTIELRLDDGRIELLRALFEDDDHNVVAQVALAVNLLLVVFFVRNQGRHVVHDVVVLEDFQIN